MSPSFMICPLAHFRPHVNPAAIAGAKVFPRPPATANSTYFEINKYILYGASVF
jgi:hypothetical protein